MPENHYRLLPAFAASAALLLAACSADRPTDDAIAVKSKFAVNTQPQQVATDADGMDTESNILTVLGLAKKPKRPTGPQVGEEVSPSLWNATHDTLNFMPIASEDLTAGYLVTDWYTNPRKPNERLRITVYITSRALRADSLSVRIEREERGPGGGWQPSPVAQQTVTDLENAILQRARQIHAETYQEQTYEKRS